MKSQDLRIGNYIVFMEDDSIAKVKGIHTNPDGVDVDFKEEETYIELSQFCGIPLTEEILLKCGFVKVQGFINGVGLFYSYKHKNLKYALSASFRLSVLDIKITNLNQLQNLYYSLTGEELEVCL